MVAGAVTPRFRQRVRRQHASGLYVCSLTNEAPSKIIRAGRNAGQVVVSELERPVLT